MAYVRKTKDEFQLYIDYGWGDGWEHEVSTDSRAEIKEYQKEYSENCPQFLIKIKRVRVPIGVK